MYNAKAYSAASATSPLASAAIPRRDPTDHDVQIEILFCGICHSDLHQVRNEWQSVMPTVYPCVPGHEIVGRVTGVGSAVKGFKPGDLVLAVNGKPVDDSRDLTRRVATLLAGTKASFTLIREGKTDTLTATIGARKKPSCSSPAPIVRRPLARIPWRRLGSRTIVSVPPSGPRAAISCGSTSNGSHCCTSI